MIGPLPARYRLTVLIVTLFACLALALWLAQSMSVPHIGYLLGLAIGCGAGYVLLHDFTRRPTR